jgi:putative endonuclease
MKMSELYYVYLACCANGSVYTGHTRNVERRMVEHNAGRGGRYT